MLLIDMYFARFNGPSTSYVRANKLFTSTHTWRRLKDLVSEKIWKATVTMAHFRFGEGMFLAKSARWLSCYEVSDGFAVSYYLYVSSLFVMILAVKFLPSRHVMT